MIGLTRVSSSQVIKRIPLLLLNQITLFDIPELCPFFSTSWQGEYPRYNNTVEVVPIQLSTNFSISRDQIVRQMWKIILARNFSILNNLNSFHLYFYYYLFILFCIYSLLVATLSLYSYNCMIYHWKEKKNSIKIPNMIYSKYVSIFGHKQQ